MSKIQTALNRAKNDGPRKGRSRSPKLNEDDALSATASFLAQDPRHIALSGIRRIALDEGVFAGNHLLQNDAENRHPARSAYRMLRTRLMRNMRSNNWRILGVSSIGKGEGKTFTSINLAISIAAELGQEAVLVDLDLQRPSVNQYLGADPADFTSLRTYLEDDSKDIADLLVCPGIERLGCMLSHDPFERSSDVLASPRGKQLFTELRERIFEKTVIIVDLPPLLATDDALAVAPMLDALLLVVAEGEAERADLADAKHMLEEFEVIGTVLNKSRESEGNRPDYY